MRYRVDELARRTGLSVDTVRFYQTRGLLPPPEREGRVAWYSDAHLERLARVRELKDNGFTLASIRRLLAGDLDVPDQALVTALIDPLEERDATERLLTLDELASETGVTRSLLEAIEREGLLVPRRGSGGPLYTRADAAAVSAGLALLETGLPLSELLALAREHDDAMQRIAQRAVDLFIRFVRDPIRAGADDDQEAADRLVSAFRTMLPATTALVSHHFTRVLLAEAMARIEAEGSDHEIEAVRDESQRRPERSWGA